MVDQVLIRMNKFYPKMRGAFAGYEIRRYSADPGTGGSYLAYGPGQVTRFWRIWEQPLSRVAFAGEHTDALYPGTIEGALRSGKRAASQVRDLHAGKTPVIEGAPMVAKAEGGRTDDRRREEEPVCLVHPPVRLIPSPAPEAPARAFPVRSAIRGFFSLRTYLVNRCFKAEFSALTRWICR